MSDYDQLLGTAARIADAAIEWDMQLMGWYKAEEGWVSDTSVSGTETYVLDRTGMYVEIVGEEGPRHQRAEFAPTAATDFREIWRGWYERIFGLFRPWQALPEPSGFQPSIDAVANAISVVNVATTVSGDRVGDVAGIKSANEDLDSALTSLCGEVLAMSGAMDTFALAYSNRVPNVVRGQAAILGVMGWTLASEQNLFAELRHDIAQVADDLLEVMEDRSSGGAATALGIIGAVLAGASLFFSGGTSAVLIANGSAVLGVLSPFVPEDEAPTPAQETFGGSDPMAVYDNAVRFLDDVRQAVADEEEVIRGALTGARRMVVEDDGEEFDLSRPPSLLDVPDAEIIEVDPSTMAFLGGVVVPFISDNLDVARDQAVASPDRSAWERDAAIGLGPVGPYGDWVDLHDAFLQVSVGTSRTLDDVGQKLIDVARLYVQVDDVVEQRLAELERDGALDVPQF